MTSLNDPAATSTAIRHLATSERCTLLETQTRSRVDCVYTILIISHENFIEVSKFVISGPGRLDSNCAIPEMWDSGLAILGGVRTFFSKLPSRFDRCRTVFVGTLELDEFYDRPLDCRFYAVMSRLFYFDFPFIHHTGTGGNRVGSWFHNCIRLFCDINICSAGFVICNVLKQ